MEKIKNGTLNIIYSLIASFIWNYATTLLQIKNFPKIDQLLELISTNKFIVYWLVFLVLILIIRHFIRNKIEQKQEPYSTIFSMPYNYDFKGETEYEGFLWKFEGNIKSPTFHRDILDKELKNEDVVISYIDGPYCIHDFRKMKEQRTYFGLFKYTCKKCGYNRKLLKSSWTLECELKDEIESEQRMKNSNIVDITSVK